MALHVCSGTCVHFMYALGLAQHPHMPERGEMRQPNPGEAFIGSNRNRSHSNKGRWAGPACLLAGVGRGQSHGIPKSPSHVWKCTPSVDCRSRPQSASCALLRTSQIPTPHPLIHPPNPIDRRSMHETVGPSLAVSTRSTIVSAVYLGILATIILPQRCTSVAAQRKSVTHRARHFVTQEAKACAVRGSPHACLAGCRQRVAR
eukprot:364425-Chlamydomonas_euryale.AAC.4